jgi:hypothetical protein
MSGYYAGDIFDQAAATIEALRAERDGLMEACMLPPGWRSILTEAPSEVLEAMDRVPTRPSAGYWARVYAAMLAAAPEATSLPAPPAGA